MARPDYPVLQLSPSDGMVFQIMYNEIGKLVFYDKRTDYPFKKLDNSTTQPLVEVGNMSSTRMMWASYPSTATANTLSKQFGIELYDGNLSGTTLNPFANQVNILSDTHNGYNYLTGTNNEIVLYFTRTDDPNKMFKVKYNNVEI